MTIVYATFADITARFDAADIVQTADVEQLADAQPYVEQRLKRAGVIIDGWVSGKYGDRSNLPVPDLLHELAMDLAFHDMFRREPPEVVVKNKDAAMSTLKAIAAGTVKIDDGNPDVQPTRPGAVLVEGETKIFGRSNMSGF